MTLQLWLCKPPLRHRTTRCISDMVDIPDIEYLWLAGVSPRIFVSFQPSVLPESSDCVFQLALVWIVLGQHSISMLSHYQVYNLFFDLFHFLCSNFFYKHFTAQYHQSFCSRRYRSARGISLTVLSFSSTEGTF